MTNLVDHGGGQDPALHFFLPALALRPGIWVSLRLALRFTTIVRRGAGV